MARIKEQSNRTPRGSISNFVGDAEVQEVSGNGNNGRENSPSGITEIEPEGIKLIQPKDNPVVWPHFMKALSATQHQLARSKNIDVEKLRIVRGYVPAHGLPEDYDTGHGGIIIKQSDEFAALLSDGRILSAVEA